VIEHIEDHKKLYEAARSLRKTGMPLSWRAGEISAVLDELIRLRHIVASGLAVSINQENKDLRFEVEGLKTELDRVKALNHQQFGDAIRKNAEVEALKRGMVGDYDLDAWLEFSTGAVQKDADRLRWLRRHEFDIGSYHRVHEHSAAAWFEHITDESIDQCIADEAEFAAQFEVKS
jgi:hypothetical protein